MTHPSFIFTAAGDYGANPNTQNVLRGVSQSGSDFHLFLGDLSYNELMPETEWCSFVKTHIGTVKPVLLSGNHESDGTNGFIDNFAACLLSPFRVSGEYAREFYFDYPKQGRPLARFIMISPNLTFTNDTYEYQLGTAHRKWLDGVIENAHRRNIPWIIVGMHKNCINLEEKPCEVGVGLINTLVEKGIDLIVQGHSHNYQRTKQLRCISYRTTVTECIAKKDPHQYSKDQGVVIAIVGTGGRDLRNIILNQELPYFATWNGSANEPEHGFLKVIVTEKDLIAEYVNTSFRSPYTRYADYFTISETEAQEAQ